MYIMYIFMCIVMVLVLNLIDVVFFSVFIGINVYIVIFIDFENDQLYYNMMCIFVICLFKIYDCEYCYI